MKVEIITEDGRELTKISAEEGKTLFRISNDENVGDERVLGMCFRDKYGNVLEEPFMEKVEDFEEREIKEEEESTPTEDDEETLEKLKEAKALKINEIIKYDKSDKVNSFFIGDVPMWLSVSMRQQIATQISANEAVGRETMTRWFNGMSFTFPISTWKEMLIALEVYCGDAINVTESHKASVMALTAIEEVEAYDITQGYPKQLVFDEI